MIIRKDNGNSGEVAASEKQYKNHLGRVKETFPAMVFRFFGEEDFFHDFKIDKIKSTTSSLEMVLSTVEWEGDIPAEKVYQLTFNGVVFRCAFNGGDAVPLSALRGATFLYSELDSMDGILGFLKGNHSLIIQVDKKNVEYFMILYKNILINEMRGGSKKK